MKLTTALLLATLAASPVRADDVVLDQLDRCLGEEFAARVDLLIDGAPCSEMKGGCSSERSTWESTVEQQCVFPAFDHCLVRPEPVSCLDALAGDLAFRADAASLPSLEQIRARDDLTGFRRQGTVRARERIDEPDACSLQDYLDDPEELRSACGAFVAANTFFAAQTIRRRIRPTTGETR